MKQRQEIQALKKELKTLSGNKGKAKDTSPGHPPKTKSTKNAQAPIAPVGKKPPESKEKPRPPEIPRVSDTVGGVLTRKGNLVVKPSVQYFFSDNNNVFLDAFTFLPAIAIGLIDIREIKRHSVIGNITFRYGVTDRLELDFKVEYVYRNDEQRSRLVSVCS